MTANTSELQSYWWSHRLLCRVLFQCYGLHFAWKKDVTCCCGRQNFRLFYGSLDEFTPLILFAAASRCINVWTAVTGRLLMVSFCCFCLHFAQKFVLGCFGRQIFGDVMAFRIITPSKSFAAASGWIEELTVVMGRWWMSPFRRFCFVLPWKCFWLMLWPADFAVILYFISD